MNDSDIRKIKAHLVTSVQREISHRPPPPEQHRKIVVHLIQNFFNQLNITLPENTRDALLKDVYNELSGYGPLQSLLDSKDISEIMVVGPDLVFIERNGVLAETNVKFDDDAHVIRIGQEMPVTGEVEDTPK